MGNQQNFLERQLMQTILLAILIFKRNTLVDDSESRSHCSQHKRDKVLLRSALGIHQKIMVFSKAKVLF